MDSLAAAGSSHCLQGGMKGLEKESLRVTPLGQISQTPHPAGLGSALKHPYVTTDYSEALIELITPPFTDAAETLAYLDNIHRFVHQHIGDEALWAASMPCAINGEESIPIAQYGSSNVGKMRHIYRRGLAWRYGRAMQSIAGIHFNYSVNESLWPVLQELLGGRETPKEFIAAQYFGMIRNIQRHGWLVLYLFGASPAFSQSFFTSRAPHADAFEHFDATTLYQPYATSLRMSDIGYRNDSQSGLDICFNRLDDYCASLIKAINTPHPPYERIGVKVDGEYRQLSANILQISNEYYSPIRPKQISRSCDSPTMALRRYGVRYVELRSLDLSPEHPDGLSLPQMRLLEVFLLCCLLKDSPPMDAAESAEIGANTLAVAHSGRLPGLQLRRGGQALGLREWGLELAEAMRAVAEVLDRGQSSPVYLASLNPLLAALEEPDSTPSARVLAEMREHHESFQDFALRKSLQHAGQFRARPLEAAQAETFRREAADSLVAQQQTEASDSLSFEEYLARYFACVE